MKFRRTTMMQQGWLVAQGAIGYAVIWPWAWGLTNDTPPPNVWWYAGLMFGFGAICTGLRKLFEE